jgi:hypothetical protein
MKLSWIIMVHGQNRDLRPFLELVCYGIKMKISAWAAWHGQHQFSQTLADFTRLSNTTPVIKTFQYYTCNTLMLNKTNWLMTWLTRWFCSS